MKKLRLFNIAASFVFILAAIAAIIYHQDIIDWWRLQSYKPNDLIIQIADDTTMIDRGRNLFFASQPVIEGAAAFNTDCTNSGEETIILGCYRYQQIFIFDVTDQRLAGVEEVTAAHEMLHAAYERLPVNEKNKINRLLGEQIKKVTNQRILDLIEVYRSRDESQLYNEMHSILGTEYPDLDQELENYYKKYFNDRQVVVSMSEKYESVFQNSKDKIVQMDAQLADLKNQIDQNNSNLESMYQELQSLSNQLLSLRDSGQIEAYNASVPNYNSKVNIYNALVVRNEELVNQHNQIVEERNHEAVAQNDLYKSLDSREYQELPQN